MTLFLGVKVTVAHVSLCLNCLLVSWFIYVESLSHGFLVLWSEGPMDQGSINGPWHQSPSAIGSQISEIVEGLF